MQAPVFVNHVIKPLAYFTTSKNCRHTPAIDVQTTWSHFFLTFSLNALPLSPLNTDVSQAPSSVSSSSFSLLINICSHISLPCLSDQFQPHVINCKAHITFYMSPQSSYVLNSSCCAHPTSNTQVFEHTSKILHTLFPQLRILFSSPWPPSQPYWTLIYSIPSLHATSLVLSLYHLPCPCLQRQFWSFLLGSELSVCLHALIPTRLWAT